MSTFGEDWIVKHYEIDCIKAENPDYVKDLTRASVLVNKSRTSLDWQTQDSISVKVKTLLEADVDLMGWYQIAEAQK